MSGFAFGNQNCYIEEAVIRIYIDSLNKPIQPIPEPKKKRKPTSQSEPLPANQEKQP